MSAARRAPRRLLLALEPYLYTVRAVVLIGSARKPLPDLVWSEHGMGASQPSTLRVLQHRPDAVKDRHG